MRKLIFGTQGGGGAGDVSIGTVSILDVKYRNCLHSECNDEVCKMHMLMTRKEMHGYVNTSKMPCCVWLVEL